jgi:hypothetical protein
MWKTTCNTHLVIHEICIKFVKKIQTMFPRFVQDLTKCYPGAVVRRPVDLAIRPSYNQPQETMFPGLANQDSEQQPEITIVQPVSL